MMCDSYQSSFVCVCSLPSIILLPSIPRFPSFSSFLSLFLVTFYPFSIISASFQSSFVCVVSPLLSCFPPFLVFHPSLPFFLLFYLHFIHSLSSLLRFSFLLLLYNLPSSIVLPSIPRFPSSSFFSPLLLTFFPPFSIHAASFQSSFVSVTSLFLSCFPPFSFSFLFLPFSFSIYTIYFLRVFFC